jgi:hypothetical protein
MPVPTSVDERRARGKDARARLPRSVHAGWVPAADRPSPVDLLAEQDADREPDLVPVRHGRMLVSPFTFYRGAARIMSADLKDTPTAGLPAQLCGDAHLLNFGVFGSPERRLVFDLNDFDETLPGPFEYDVKRMATSFEIAGRDNGLSAAGSRDLALASLTAYTQAMAGFARMGTMAVWYASLDEDQIKRVVRGQARERAKLAKRAQSELERASAKAHARDSLQALSKLGEVSDGRYRIVSQPPIIVPLRDVAPGLSPGEIDRMIHPAPAGGRSPGRTPGRVTRWRSPRTSARATRSAAPWPTSPSATPTRTSATTRSSPRRSGPAASPPQQASYPRVRPLSSG